MRPLLPLQRQPTSTVFNNDDDHDEMIVLTSPKNPPLPHVVVFGASNRNRHGWYLMVQYFLLWFGLFTVTLNFATLQSKHQFTTNTIIVNETTAFLPAVASSSSTKLTANNDEATQEMKRSTLRLGKKTPLLVVSQTNGLPRNTILAESRHQGVTSSSETATAAPAASTTTTTTRAHKFAYAFVVSGCDPVTKPTYRYYLYNVMIAAEILHQQQGSKADVVAFFQMSWSYYQSTGISTLPVHEEEWLRAMNVKIRYIPPHAGEVFYRTMMDKFRILSLTEYDRVLLLDADVMPLQNMDFLFEASMAGILKENVVMEGKLEPANGGFFMLKPNATDFLRLNEILASRAASARTLPFPHFDEVRGWGHQIVEPDYWHTSMGKRGQNWTFWAAFADQGLLYHWTKYEQQSASILMRNGKVENWGKKQATEHVGNGPVLEELLNRPFGDKVRKSPLECFVHFTGSKKPWFGVKNHPELVAWASSHSSSSTNTSSVWNESSTGNRKNNKQRADSPKVIWFQNLGRLNERLQMNLTWTDSDEKKSESDAKPSKHKKSNSNDERPFLGMFPVFPSAKTVDSIID